MTDPNRADHYWLPFTPNRDFRRDPRNFARAEGIHYWSEEGARIIDACSGLFCVPLGHGRREIADAVHAQLLELDFAGAFMRGHEKAYAVARRIAELTPDGIEHVFFASSGSEAVDTSIKIALAYHHARGEGHRTMLVSRDLAYHGVNMGGVSLSGIRGNRSAFGPSASSVVHMRHTGIPENRYAIGRPEHGGGLADDLERFCGIYGGENIAAVFVEPVAGSTGCLAPPRGYLERLRELCTEYGILLVFDEVITGLGRMGHPFAAQAFGVTPDIMTMAKALTNGMQPMSAVAVSGDVYDSIVERADGPLVEFFHGYTYSGHPAACAAAATALDLLREEKSFDRSAALMKPLSDGIASMNDVAHVVGARACGLFGAVDLEPVAGEPGREGYEVQKRLFDAGLHLKATGDSLLIAPAFVCETGDVEDMFGILREVLGG
ncbi:MAG: aspartate aminotransferase family protein [Deltaproteobacteria bacterium]|nr:aspartate aminotransferase family protein [Deltaproteobacteria bacterium]